MTNKFIEEKVEELNEEFIEIIKEFAPNWVPHLIDDDENKGQMFRENIKKTLHQAQEQTKQDIIEIMKQELLDYALPKPKTESDKVYNETLGEISEEIINKIKEM